ncbi:MAG: FapA family protein [Polyangiaceae bacterium]
MANETKVARLKVEVRSDGTAAKISFVARDPNAVLPDCEEVKRALTDARVTITKDVEAKVDAYCDSLANETTRFQSLVIAEGRLPYQGRPAELTWDKSVAPKTRVGKKGEDGDHYAFRSMICVEKDNLLGNLLPAKAAVPGVDVHGKELPPRTMPKDIELHRTVRADGHERMRLYAAVGGVVRFEDNRLWIDESVNVKGDVDFATGNIACTIEVKIGGAILDNFTVKSTESIFVSGPIQGATVHSDADVHALGGILAGGRGLVSAQRKLFAKFAEEANLRSAGDILVNSALIKCDVQALGRLIAPQATVRGGLLYARLGAEIGELGCGAATHTRIAIGIRPEVAAAALAKDDDISVLSEHLQPFERERQKWLTLSEKEEGLNPQQHIRLRQVQSEINFLRLLIAELADERDSMLGDDQPEQKAVLEVTKTIQPGAQVQFGTMLVVLRRPLPGPIRIETRAIEKIPAVVAISSTGDVQVLPTIRATQRSHSKSARWTGARNYMRSRKKTMRPPATRTPAR